MNDLLRSEIREVIAEHARLAGPVDGLSPGDDLFQAGMTSHASVNVMLALEARFDVEFPDEMLKRSVFETIDSIADAIERIRLAAA